jgi:hypothetical protein
LMVFVIGHSPDITAYAANCKRAPSDLARYPHQVRVPSVRT